MGTSNTEPMMIWVTMTRMEVQFAANAMAIAAAWALDHEADARALGDKEAASAYRLQAEAYEALNYTFERKLEKAAGHG